jgi:prepilin-type N-terminal cleavage/methylation domain-containing protein
MTTAQRAAFRGFTLIELLIVVSVVFVLGALVLPALNRPRVPRQRINCVNNLKQIGLSFRTWALDNGDKYPAQVSVTNGGTMELVGNGFVYQHFAVMSNELSTPKVLACPNDKDPKFVIADTFGPVNPTNQWSRIPFTNDNNLSYFASVDASDDRPQMLLAGDKQLALNGVSARHKLIEVYTNSALSWMKSPHGTIGNVAVADGSVQQVTCSLLRSLVASSQAPTNRLAVP